MYDFEAEKVREIFDYDSETGDLTWKQTFNKFMKVGKVAGSKQATGVLIGLFGKLIPARRLVWAWHHGEWPEGNIRSKDGNPLNHRIENLMSIGCRTPKVKRVKAVYATPYDVPISLVREFFRLDSRNVPFWKKKTSPKTKLDEPAGRRYGGEVYIGFMRHLYNGRDIAYALLNGEWPKK